MTNDILNQTIWKGKKNRRYYIPQVQRVSKTIQRNSNQIEVILQIKRGEH